MAKVRRKNRSFIIVIGITFLLSLVYVYNAEQARQVESSQISLSQLVAEVDSGQIKKIEISDNDIVAIYQDDSKATSRKETFSNISDFGIDLNKVEVEIIDTTKGQFWKKLLGDLIPFFIILGLIIFMFRSMKPGGAMGFGQLQSKEDTSKQKRSKVTFKDVAGYDEAKNELVEAVDFLKHPKKYTQMGARIPRGVVLFGPPGTGKTLLAKAVAGEAGVPFFNISGSEFEEMFVGVGASRVRDLFNKAKKASPAIIFIDELDAVGKHRGSGPMGSSHSEQTLNQILVEMDGFDTDTNVILIAATNRPDVLDPALLRPGRFDRRVVLDMPNLSEREDILISHSRGKTFDKSVDMKKIARQTPGFSGADLANVLNESAILTAQSDHKAISRHALEHAMDKVILGSEKKSRLLNDKEKEITSYHESGHAIVAHMLSNCDPVHKVSIVSRGRALGVTWYLPEAESYLTTESKFHDDLAAMLGGHVAERLTFGEVTTGSSNDLMRATEIARKMVTEYGMSKKLGTVIWHSRPGMGFLGEMNSSKNYSEEVAFQIDTEVKEIIDQAYATAEAILSKQKTKLKKLSEVLIKQEMISSEEFEKVMGKKSLK